MAHIFNSTIMRAYDIRGTVNKNLNTKDAYHLGRSFATYMHQHNIKGNLVLGRDGRISSPELYEALVKGLTESGINVIYIGVVPTPALYYAHFTQDSAAAIMITGSHNPGDQNGFKMVMQHASFFGDNIQDLAKIAAKGDYVSGQGSVKEIDIKDEYIDTLISRTIKPNGKKLKIAWDSGNGATGEIVEMLTKRLAGEHVLINTKIDGNFPAHHPDPTVPENLEQIMEVVIKAKCDFGIAFDGDGDRIGTVDNKGRMIFGDQQLLIYAKDLLSRIPNSKIIGDVKTSNMVFDKIREHGGQPIIWKTGHSHIKAKMKKEGAILAGEMSGHTFFGEDYFGFDDALFGACKIINILSHSQETLGNMIDAMPVLFSTPELRIDIEEEIKFKVVDDLKKLIVSKNLEFNDLDGIRVTKSNGWWLLRASNTQSCLVMRVEGNTLHDMDTIIAEVKGYFAEVGFIPVGI
jgi:phosphomannomutase